MQHLEKLQKARGLQWCKYSGHFGGFLKMNQLFKVMSQHPNQDFDRAIQRWTC